MKAKSGQSGLSLMEMTVVVAIVALLAVLAMPAVKALLGSFETSGGAKCMISAALSTARGIAAKEQHYAGVRFQKAYNPDDPDNLLSAPQYMIFIIHDAQMPSSDSPVNGFRAVDGLQPIKLPESIGVMDLRYDPDSGDGIVDNDAEAGNQNVTRDTTSFSIVFSPSGKLIIHNVFVINRDGKKTSNTCNDDIFNTLFNVTNGIGSFIQDKQVAGLQQESSRSSFIIYEREKFRQAYSKGRAWTDYLSRAAVEGRICVNPYTGTIISRD